MGNYAFIPLGKLWEVVHDTPDNCAPKTQKDGDVGISSHVVQGCAGCYFLPAAGLYNVFGWLRSW